MTSQQIKTLIEPAVAAVGFELWGLEFSSQGHVRVLRVFIDSPEGVNVNDCAKVSHQISGVLDLEDPVAGEYNLEVSSPGIDRPLFCLEHFERYIGEKADVRLMLPANGKRRFTGIIAQVKQKSVEMDVDGETIEFAISSLKKAKLLPEM